MAGQTLGIVGLGRIGAHLASLARPFGMTILGYDPFIDSPPAEDVERVELGFLSAQTMTGCTAKVQQRKDMVFGYRFGSLLFLLFRRGGAGLVCGKNPGR
jgi:hypothetical protein